MMLFQRSRSPQWCARYFVGLGILSVLLILPSAWGMDVPPLTGRVVDRAHILSPSVLSELDSILAAHENKTSNQVAVLTIPSLEGYPIEDFSHQVATTWALGKKGTDNGVLFLIAIQDKKIRIEVGYGLEGTLTDAKSSRIIRHEVVPRFRAGDFPGGVVAGTQAILGTIEGTYTNSPSLTDRPGVGLLGKFFIAVTIGTIVGLFLGAGRRLNGSVIGGFIAFMVGISAALLIAMLAGITALFLVNLFARGGGHSSHNPLTHDFGLGWPRTRGGPFGGSGGFSGGGFGGGFGGGGGSFGGGGASGGW